MHTAPGHFGQTFSIVYEKIWLGTYTDGKFLERGGAGEGESWLLLITREKLILVEFLCIVPINFNCGGMSFNLSSFSFCESFY